MVSSSFCDQLVQFDTRSTDQVLRDKISVCGLGFRFGAGAA